MCGRNWAEDPILGNSDLWVITCNVLRRRAVSGCLSDSISPTQSSAVHSLGLNCPISFRPDAQLFSAALFLSTGSSSTRENDTLIHTKWLSVSYKQVRILDRTTATHTSYFPLSDTHTHTHLYSDSETKVVCAFPSLTSFCATESTFSLQRWCWWHSWQSVNEAFFSRVLRVTCRIRTQYNGCREV